MSIHKNWVFFRTIIFSLDIDDWSHAFLFMGLLMIIVALARDAGALGIGLAGNTRAGARFIPEPYIYPGEPVAALFHRKLITPSLRCTRRS